MIGFDVDNVLGKNWFDNFVPERFRKNLVELFENLLKGNQVDSHPCDYPILTSTGEERQVVWACSKVTSNEGKIIGILSSGEDVTDRRKAETEVWKTEIKSANVIRLF